MAKEDGEDWAWIGEQKFATFRNSSIKSIRFVTLQDARTALSEERSSVRKGFKRAIEEITFDDWRDYVAVLAALDRILPEES